MDYCRLKTTQIHIRQTSYYVGNDSSLNHTSLRLILGKKEIHGKLLLEISSITAYFKEDAEVVHERQAWCIGRTL